MTKNNKISDGPTRTQLEHVILALFLLSSEMLAWYGRLSRPNDFSTSLRQFWTSCLDILYPKKFSGHV